MNLKIKMLRKCVEGVCKEVTIYGYKLLIDTAALAGYDYVRKWS